MSVEQSLEAFCRPEIAHRAEVMLGGVALAGALVLGLRALAERSSAAHVIVPAAESGFGYLVLGVATRSLIQHHQSRAQIGALAIVITLAVAARPSRAREDRVKGWLTGLLAASAGVVAAKWALEPQAFSTPVRVRPSQWL